MLTPLEAYRRVLRNDPTFKLEGGVDYDHEYYVFTGPLDMYAVDKRLGTVVAFVPTTDMKKYFDAVKRRPLDINSLQHSDNDELYLEHFGIKNMKWGVRRFQNKDGSLTEAGRKRYGSGNDGEELSGGGGGGGAPEEDEEMKKKIEEAAKKAGMTVDEYRKKMGSKLYDLFGGKYKKEAEDLRKRQLESSKNARLLEKEGGKKNEDADSERVNAKVYGHYAKEANKSYEKSIAGRYDKLKATMTERGTAKKKEVGRTVSKYQKKVGSKLYDAAGGYHKKEAEEYAEAADDTLRYAQSVDRKGDADLAKAASARRKGNTGAHSSYATYGGNAKLAAKKEYERASVLRAGASKSKEKYEKSLAGRYDKLKATMAERGKAKKKDSGDKTHVLPKMKSATATAKPMRKLTSKELAKIRSEARIKQLKKDGDYTGEYKKKRRK